MHSLTAGLDVPIRTLAQTSRNGSAVFEVARVNGLTRPQQELFFVPHRKDFYLLALITGGGTRHWLDGVPYTLEPHKLYFSAPQQVFLKEEGRFDAFSVCFTQEFLDLEERGSFDALPLLQNPHHGHALTLAPDEEAFVEDLLAKMLDEQQRAPERHTSMLRAYLRVLLIYLSRIYSAQAPATETGPDRQLLARFRTLLNGHITRHHDVAAYADLLHLSPGHLSERIKAQSGKTPLEHIHERLLLEAKRLLFHTDGSAKEIAYELGFEDASYFNRFFKRLTAATPVAYRASIREMYQ